MEVVAETRNPLDLDCDALVVGVFADGPLGTVTAALDAANDRVVSRLRERNEHKHVFVHRRRMLPLFQPPRARPSPRMGRPHVLNYRMIGFDCR